MHLKVLVFLSLLVVTGPLSESARAQFTAPPAGSTQNGGTPATATVRFPANNIFGSAYVPGSGTLRLLRGGGTVLRPMVIETYIPATDEYEVTVSGYGNPTYQGYRTIDAGIPCITCSR